MFKKGESSRTNVVFLTAQTFLFIITLVVMLRFTIKNHINIFSGIQVSKLCRIGAILFWLTMDSWTLTIRFVVFFSEISDAFQERLTSRCMLELTGQNLLNNFTRLGIRASQWRNYRWNMEYCENSAKERDAVCA